MVKNRNRIYFILAFLHSLLFVSCNDATNSRVNLNANSEEDLIFRERNWKCDTGILAGNPPAGYSYKIWWDNGVDSTIDYYVTSSTFEVCKPKYIGMIYIEAKSKVPDSSTLFGFYFKPNTRIDRKLYRDYYKDLNYKSIESLEIYEQTITSQDEIRDILKKLK